MRKEPRIGAKAPVRQSSNARPSSRFRCERKISSGEGQNRRRQRHQSETGCDCKFQPPDTPGTNTTPIIRHSTDPHDRYKHMGTMAAPASPSPRGWREAGCKQSGCDLSRRLQRLEYDNSSMDASLHRCPAKRPEGLIIPHSGQRLSGPEKCLARLSDAHRSASRSPAARGFRERPDGRNRDDRSAGQPLSVTRASVRRGH